VKDDDIDQRFLGQISKFARGCSARGAQLPICESRWPTARTLENRAKTQAVQKIQRCNPKTFGLKRQ